MRFKVISSVMKEEWLSNRRKLLWYMIVSLIFDIAMIVISRIDWVMRQVEQSNLSFEEFSLTVFAILFIPYVVTWVMLTFKADKDKSSGLFKFIHMLPISIRELVTAKFIAAFLINLLLAGWFSMLWRAYEMVFIDAGLLQAWTGICMVVFLLTFAIHAVQLGLFFSRGSTSIVLMILMLLLSQLDAADTLADQTMVWMAHTPFFMWGISFLLIGCIWILCWHWSVKTYLKY
ncbi:hypothetical protein GCM10028778_15450 [Barrientosiimonas marina]|uniref:ABC transporter permease n=1 Tax=Lentibacillus kimchii TaxID=1542911 RepID=A0ABW2UQY3_9BACI